MYEEYNSDVQNGGVKNSIQYLYSNITRKQKHGTNQTMQECSEGERDNKRRENLLRLK